MDEGRVYGLLIRYLGHDAIQLFILFKLLVLGRLHGVLKLRYQLTQQLRLLKLLVTSCHLLRSTVVLLLEEYGLSTFD